MRSLLIFSILTLAVVFTTGCEVVRLANGKYETTLSGRGDFAAVYKDMIILRLRNPYNETGTEDGYWDWGGTYKIIDENRIELNMSREESHRWDFYYGLRKQGNAIVVLDHRAENSFRLEYIPAVPDNRKKSNNNYTAPTGGSYPMYR